MISKNLKIKSGEIRVAQDNRPNAQKKANNSSKGGKPKKKQSTAGSNNTPVVKDKFESAAQKMGIYSETIKAHAMQMDPENHVSSCLPLETATDLAMYKDVVDLILTPLQGSQSLLVATDNVTDPISITKGALYQPEVNEVFSGTDVDISVGEWFHPCLNSATKPVRIIPDPSGVITGNNPDVPDGPALTYACNFTTDQPFNYDQDDGCTTVLVYFDDEWHYVALLLPSGTESINYGSVPVTRFGFYRTSKPGLFSIRMAFADDDNYWPNLITTHTVCPLPNWSYVVDSVTDWIIGGASVLTTSEIPSLRDGGHIATAVCNSGEFLKPGQNFSDYIHAREHRSKFGKLKEGAYDFLLKKRNSDWSLNSVKTFQDPFTTNRGTYIMRLMSFSEQETINVNVNQNFQYRIFFSTPNPVYHVTSSVYDPNFHVLGSAISKHYKGSGNSTHSDNLKGVMKNALDDTLSIIKGIGSGAMSAVTTAAATALFV